MKAAGRSRGTVELRRHQLRRLAAAYPAGPGALRERDLVRWLASHDWSRETLRSHRAALVGYFAWAARLGLVTRSPAEGLPPVAARPPMPKPAAEAAVMAGRSGPDGRTRLMVALGAFAGLRRAEIATSRGDWLIETPGGWALLVRGKGGRLRLVPVPNWLAAEISAVGPGWLFPGAVDGHMSPAWVGKLVGRALPAGVTCHQLRHRFATRAYAGSRDLLAVQQLLGHTKPETTAAYVALASDSLRVTAQAAWAA